jgi:hypothetical protein
VRPGAPSFGTGCRCARGDRCSGSAITRSRPGVSLWASPRCERRDARFPRRDLAHAPHRRRREAVAIVVGIGSVVLWSARSLPRRLALNVADRSSDAALAAASRRPGLLAVAPGVERPQQMTRRPIVIDPQALDMVTYAPAALPAMVRAIEDLYGIPFESPRPEHRNLSMLPAAPVKESWERRSPTEWASIAAEFGVTDVLVPASWRIRLPELARSRAFALHSITEPAGSSP